MNLGVVFPIATNDDRPNSVGMRSLAPRRAVLKAIATADLA
jgi:hypothetical protein